MKRFIVELGVVPSALDPLIIYRDNMGAIANAQEPRSHKRLKHIKLRYHSIREYIEDGEVKICKVHTDLNVADPLTKALPRAKHDQHQNAMGVRPRLIVRLDGNADDGNAEEGNSEEGNAEEGNAEAGNSEEGNVANGNAPNGNSYEGNLDILDDSDGNVDSDFMGNDYDAADGDHDLFINNVDLEVHDNNEHQNVDEIENDATLIEDDDLQLTAEVEEHLQNKFKVFNEAVDMTNPEFKMGMTFSDVKELRNALQAYIIRNRVPVHKIRNEPKRIESSNIQVITLVKRGLRAPLRLLATVRPRHCSSLFRRDKRQAGGLLQLLPPFHLRAAAGTASPMPSPVRRTIVAPGRKRFGN
ncbi:hypothetical protein QYE76_045045 [Lolium multiflorum]|uniref:Polyprotein n=1 Tax=Lolium multiflorum TaxID=4521 RepID=A0AAD8WX40_LOLMU|nr:hypothetical protein QYE76_045045 [Lolium multiflorum]